MPEELAAESVAEGGTIDPPSERGEPSGASDGPEEGA
jgi:hypothetical protein